jgi:RecJ-like exonuclease
MAAGLFFSCYVIAGEDLTPIDAPIDVSQIKPDECRRCSAKGYAPCPECHGKGVSRNALVNCPDCDGKGKIPCNKCDKDGMMDCPENCKERPITGTDGEKTKVFCVITDEWRAWDKKWSRIAEKFIDPIARAKKVPEAPEKYAPCAKCSGTGKVKCKHCDGTKELECKKCKGTGKIKGTGTCPACGGIGKIACPDCATLENLGETKEFETLKKLHDQKLVDDETYYQKLRLLVAQEKYRREVIAKRRTAIEEAERIQAEKDKEKNQEAQSKAAEKAKEEAVAQAGNKEIEEKIKALIMGFDSNLLKLDVYKQKLRELGASPEVVEKIETEQAAEAPRLQKYLELKQQFKDGKIDMKKYKDAMNSL